MRTVSRTTHGAAMAVVLMAMAGPAAAQTPWPSAGLNLSNSRYQEAERTISARTVAGLRLKWEVATIGDVTANPAVDAEFLYFPDSAGYIYKVRRADGSIVLQRRVFDYTGIEGDFARATPAIAGNLLILGNQSGKFLGAPLGQPDPQPARVFALDKNTFEPVWVTQVDATAFSFVTTSAIVAGNTAIVGVASNEELMAAFIPRDFWQFRFRGSVVALDVATGSIKWQTYTVPEGYYGGAIWSSTPAVDPARNRVYVTTGNNYMVPEQVVGCVRSGMAPALCMSPDNHFNSIIALNFTTGAIDWARRGLTYDAWNVSCGLVTPGFFVGPFFPGVYANCPDPQAPSPSRVTGPDWDFAQGPMLMPDADTDGGLVGAGQKSGMFWAFRAKDGKLKWARQVAPGGVTGGLQWGSATDGKSIFVAASNSGPAEAGGGIGPLPWTLANGSTTTSGGWAALDVKTGALLWTTPDPQGSRSEAAVSGANGVIFGCNLAGAGTMYALDARNGKPLWSFTSGGPCNAGPSIADGTVFWGSGTFISPGGPKKVFAFGLN